jgi:REP element-mobilizing transposase RayT
MNILDGVSSKKEKVDTRNNWITFMFKTKCAYQCFRKQSHMDTCTTAFREFEVHGFEFGEIGYGGNHAHLRVNIPKRYSVTDAEIILKSRSSKRMFEQHSEFRKRYPRGSFWSGYEHHQSTGAQNMEQADAYIQSQQARHNIAVVDDRQTRLAAF